MGIDKKLAHRVQNDLTAILGFIEVAVQELESDNKDIEKAIKSLVKSRQVVQVLSNALYSNVSYEE
jgi:proteasome assembly chaperone (PAC2) family protein